MSRQINQPVTVTLVRGEPSAFRRRGDRFVIAEILDTWTERRRWWEQEAEMQVYRVRLDSGGVMELGRVGNEWTLLVVHD